MAMAQNQGLLQHVGFSRNQLFFLIRWSLAQFSIHSVSIDTFWRNTSTKLALLIRRLTIVFPQLFVSSTISNQCHTTNICIIHFHWLSWTLQRMVLVGDSWWYFWKIMAIMNLLMSCYYCPLVIWHSHTKHVPFLDDEPMMKTSYQNGSKWWFSISLL